MDDLLKNAGNAISQIPQNVANFVGGAVNNVEHTFQPPIQSPVPQQQTLPQIQPNPVQQLLGGIGQFGQNVDQGINQNIIQPIEQIPQVVQSDIKNPSQIPGQVASFVGGTLAGTAQGLYKQMGSPYQSVGQFLNPLAQQQSALQYYYQNPVPTALNTLGLLGGHAGAAKATDVASDALDNMAASEFKDGLKNLSPVTEQSIPLIPSLKNALTIPESVKNMISTAVGKIKGGDIGDPVSNQILNNTTNNFIPQFARFNTIDKAGIWDNILDLKDGNMPQQIHPAMQPIVGAVRNDVLQSGRINFGATIGGEEPPKPKIVPPEQKGEQAITMDDVANYAPSLTTARGVNKVQRVLDNADSLKPEFDNDIQAIADDNGAEFSSRVKSMDSSIRKITQQKMEGKTDYNEKGLNDAYGARIVIQNPKDEAGVIKDIHQAADDGEFKVLKEQSVDKETYHAYHIDIQKQLPDGKYVRGELQIHTPQSLAEALKNHPIRSVFGENPPPEIDAIKKENAEAASNLTNEQAMQASKILEEKHKAIGDVNTLKDELSTPPGNPEPLPWEQGMPQPKPETPEVTVPTDESAKNQAMVQGGGFTGNLDPEVKSKFADWVNARNATPIEGVIKNKEFTDLNSRGLQGILDYQTEEKSPEFSDVKNYFDSKRQTVIEKTGRDFGYKKDYLPQLWQESPEQVTQVMGNRLSQSAQFTLHSLIQDYQEGIAKGLHPRFNSIGELAGWYEQRANKLIADSDFFNYLAEKGLIQPKSKAGDWVSLDPDRFPKISVRLPEGGTYNGVYAAPKPLADMINNYLRPAGDNWITKVGNMASFMKQMVMSTGIPGTAITPHTFNELVRALAFKNPITGEARAIGYSLFPKLAGNWIDGNLEKAGFWAKNGLKFNAIEEAPKEGLAGIINKVNIFNRHQDLFGKVIPALKVQYADQLFGRLKGQGMEDGEAAKLAASTSNTIFGGINWESWGRSRDNMKIASTIGFAPDWLETNARLGTGIAKALLNPADPRGKAYLTFAGNLTAAYTLANVINYHNTGKTMIQNPNGHEFDIAIGFTPDGQVRYIRPFGTGIDFVRLPVEVGAGLVKGDFSGIPNLIRNRLSTFIGTALSLISNTDYLGQGIYTDQNHPEISALQSIGNIAATLGSGILPGVATQGIKATTGGFQGPEQAISALLGGPLRYSGGASTQNLVTQDVNQGKTGPQITNDLAQMVQRAQNKTNVINNLTATDSNGKVDTQLTNSLRQAVDLYYSTQSNDTQTRLLKDQLLSSPQIYNAVKQVAIANANGDMSKVDPLLQGNQSDVKNYIEYEKLYQSAPGSAEEKQFIKDHPEVLQLMQSRNAYFAANPVPQSQQRASIYGLPGAVATAPQITSYVQQQLNAKNYNDPQVQQYLAQHLSYINQLRQQQGLGPLDQYGNIQGSKNFGISFASSSGIPAGLRRSLSREAKYQSKSGNNKVKDMIGRLGTKYKPMQRKPISLGGRIAAVKIGPHRGLGMNIPKQTKSTVSLASAPKSIITKYQKVHRPHVRLA